MRDIARSAAPNAKIISDAPGVVAHYVAAVDRPDLRVLALSQAGVGVPGERWVLVQDEHIYFENVGSVQQVRDSGRAWREYRMRNTPVLQLYRLPDRRAPASGEPRSTTPPMSRLGS